MIYFSCSGVSFVIFLFFVAGMLLSSFVIIMFWQMEKDAISKKLFLNDFDLNFPNIFCIILVGLIAGLSTSSLGLGAGTIINPILMGSLENYPPTVLLL